MGRKKIKNAYCETISVKITSEQKMILKKNDWICKELAQVIRSHIDLYLETSAVRGD